MILAFLGTFSAWHLLIFALVVLLLFGNRLPDTMRNLGKSMTEFKKGVREGEQSEEEERQRLEKSEQ